MLRVHEPVLSPSTTLRINSVEGRLSRRLIRPLADPPISESCFAGKPVALFCKRLALISVLFLAGASWHDQVQAQSASLRLTWSDTSNNEDGFKIERLVAGLVEATLTVPANAISYTDSTLVRRNRLLLSGRGFQFRRRLRPIQPSLRHARRGYRKCEPECNCECKPDNHSPGKRRSLPAGTALLHRPRPTGSASTQPALPTQTLRTLSAGFMSIALITPSISRASGSCSFALPTTLSPGNYELRLFANDGFARLATSNFTVTSGATASTASLTVSPTTVQAGATVTASWSGITVPTPKDWIGLYAPGRR